MKYEKSLEQVWQWKDQLSDEMKGMTLKEKFAHITKEADTFKRDHRLKLRKAAGIGHAIR
jgi:hypothetical protein